MVEDPPGPPSADGPEGQVTPVPVVDNGAERSNWEAMVVDDNPYPNAVEATEAGYVTLGQSDLILIVDLPDNEAAMQVSVELTKMTGIEFTTSPALSIKEFDQMMEG